MHKIPSESPEESSDSQEERALLQQDVKTKVLRTLRREWVYGLLALFCLAIIFLFSLSPVQHPYRVVLGSHKGADKYVNHSFYQNSFPNPVPLSDITTVSIPPDSYIPTLHIACILYDVDHLSIQIRDGEKPRYEIPFEDPYPYPENPTFPDLKDSNFNVIVETNPLKIQVIRRSTGEVIFDLHKPIIYTDLYIEFTFSIPTNELYGFGERFAPVQMNNGTYSLFILDRVGMIDRGVPGFNSQGHHPTYLTKEASGLYHLMLVRNVNMQEITIANTELIWRTIGGIIDLNFFLADTPEAVLERYHKYLGGWVLPALWHLGNHQCKWWGYIDADHVEDVLAGYDFYEIPLDGMWLDIDIWKNNTNLLVNKELFPTDKMMKIFKDYRKKFVSVVNTCIPFQKESAVWSYDGDIENITFRDGLNPSKPYEGKEFSGDIYFIDYLNPKSEGLWFHMLDSLQKDTPLAGVWEDANEPTDLYAWDTEKYSANRKYFYLPYYPAGQNFYDGRNLIMVSLDAQHYDGSEEFNVRCWNCVFQSKQTYRFFQARNYSMPFVLTRATVFGVQKWAYTFVPDVISDWESMRVSIGSTMNFNILGLVMSGADICGMGGDHKTPGELCGRWYQSAVFYPFARNHHSPMNRWDNYQEPFRYYGPHFKAIRDSVLLRYSLLKQLQAIIFSKKQVGTIFRPLFLEFWNDTSLPPFGSLVHEEQFLFGTFLMSAPCLYQGETTVNVFFPKARWYDLRDYKEIPVRGGMYNLSARLEEDVPYFLRGGYIVFRQDTTNVMVSDDLSNTFHLVVGLDDLISSSNTKQGKATGVMLDALSSDENYVSKTCVLHDCMMTAVLSYAEDNDKVHIILEIQSKRNQTETDRLKIDRIDILGASAQVSQTQNPPPVIACEGCPSDSSLSVESSQGVFKLKFGELPLSHGVAYHFTISRT